MKLACVLLAACGTTSTSSVSNSGGAPSFPADAVVIRACNQTGKDMTELAFNHPDDRSGALRAGMCTPYRLGGRSQYGYTYARFKLGTDEFSIQPIDVIGETELAPAHYSYQITITDYAKRHADIKAMKDQP